MVYIIPNIKHEVMTAAVTHIATDNSYDTRQNSEPNNLYTHLS